MSELGQQLAELRHASHQHDLESRPRIGRSPQLPAAPSFLRRRIIRFPQRREADPAPRSCRIAGWEGGNLRCALAEVQRRYLCGEATARRIGRCLNAPAFPALRSHGALGEVLILLGIWRGASFA
jgi:hypothetical protein